jgi:hypothetical protein
MVWSASTHSGIFQPTWQDGCGQFFWIQEPWRESVNWQHTLLFATTDKHNKFVRILLQNEVNCHKEIILPEVGDQFKGQQCTDIVPHVFASTGESTLVYTKTVRLNFTWLDFETKETLLMYLDLEGSLLTRQTYVSCHRDLSHNQLSNGIPDLWASLNTSLQTLWVFSSKTP